MLAVKGSEDWDEVLVDFWDLEKNEGLKARASTFLVVRRGDARLYSDKL